MATLVVRRDAEGQLLDPLSLDPEGLVLARSGQLYITSEGLASNMPPVAPFVRRHNLNDVEGDLGIVPDNLEGMTFGPPLPDGRQLLILVGDNNFDPAAVTQFIALAVRIAEVP